MIDTSPTPAPAFVTAAFTRHIKPDFVTAYDAWLHEVTALASTWKGYQGVTVVRPPHGGVRPEYTTILRFDTEANLRAWLDAPARLALLERAAVYADEPTEEIISEPGVDYWFTPHDAGPGSGPPTRWKMAVVLTLVIFVLLNVMREVTAPLAPLLPRPLVLLLSVTLQVAFMTYVLMPWLTKRLAFWLQPGRG